MSWLPCCEYSLSLCVTVSAMVSCLSHVCHWWNTCFSFWRYATSLVPYGASCRAIVINHRAVERCSVRSLYPCPVFRTLLPALWKAGDQQTPTILRALRLRERSPKMLLGCRSPKTTMTRSGWSLLTGTATLRAVLPQTGRPIKLRVASETAPSLARDATWIMTSAALRRRAMVIL